MTRTKDRSAGENGFSGEVAKRLATGEWTARAFVCDEALAPIAEFLQGMFGIDRLQGIVVIVVRCKDANA